MKVKPKTYNNGVISISKLQENGQFAPFFSCPVSVNKSSGSFYLNDTSNAVQNKLSLVFSVRYCALLSEIAYNCQLYKAEWNGHTFFIKDYDDFQSQHREIKLLGVSK